MIDQDQAEENHPDPYELLRRDRFFEKEISGAGYEDGRRARPDDVRQGDALVVQRQREEQPDEGKAQRGSG